MWLLGRPSPFVHSCCLLLGHAAASPNCPLILTTALGSVLPAAPVCYCLLSPARPAVLPCGGLQSPCHPPAHPLLCHHCCGMDLFLLLCDRLLSTAWQVSIAAHGSSRTGPFCCGALSLHTWLCPCHIASQGAHAGQMFSTVDWIGTITSASQAMLASPYAFGCHLTLHRHQLRCW